MISKSIIHKQICDLVAELGGIEKDDLTEKTPLIGPGSAISSRVVIELLLSVEEYSENNLGCEFDWMSDNAMSIENSNFRCIGVLTDYLFGLQQGA